MAKSSAPILPRFLAVTIAVSALCIVFSVATTEHEESSRILLLPSEGTTVCAKTTPSSCPAKCFRADPVCGADGVTYWCGCPEAACAGVEVAKLGFCEVGNGGSAPLPGQALLLVHIVWLIVLGFSVLFGFEDFLHNVPFYRLDDDIMEKLHPIFPVVLLALYDIAAKRSWFASDCNIVTSNYERLIHQADMFGFLVAVHEKEECEDDSKHPTPPSLA
ncbi:hypothetical protein VNO77_31840 [Canavalia gladiata]|uniref:Uncharacterized protein n=1 Tax=Canavalia gladiata TaxID=3824 RepID=A0AAN9Q4S7_CANGL